LEVPSVVAKFGSFFDLPPKIKHYVQACSVA
jgi:hypothetical protein